MKGVSDLSSSFKKDASMKNIVLTQQFSKEYIFEVIRLANYMKQNEFNVSHILKNKIVAMLFYESSTRTRFSFESAVYRLGGNCITTENAAQFSSVSKGESLEDTVKMINGYADMLVLRHYEDESSKRAAAVTMIPLINAGSGKSQHPTQALLDIYTIYEYFGKLENLKIAIVGDLLRGRTCDSLVYLLSKFPNNKFFFISPENSKVKDSLKKHLKKLNVEFVETSNMDETLGELDVCYMTRIQKERFSSTEEYDKAKGKFILNGDNVNLMKKNSIIMHPLPRIDEISIEVDYDIRAKYFEQAKNGLYVRMAILKMLNEY
jgi:aspartate carbamoyltransferase catalytic subunit